MSIRKLFSITVITQWSQRGAPQQAVGGGFSVPPFFQEIPTGLIGYSLD
jgi:hypothetical protein